MIEDIIEPGLNSEFSPESYIVSNLDLVPDDSKFILFCGGKKIGSAGNLVTIIGKPKARKTTFAHAILSSAIGGGERLGFGVRLPKGKRDIILIDTEQDRNDIAAALQRLKLQGDIASFTDFTNFKVYSANTLTPREIEVLLINIFRINNKIGLLMIDGLLDMVIDMNCVDECSRVLANIRKLAITNQCLIVTVLHSSKTTGYSIGHLGSFAERKSQSLLSVEKDKDESSSTISAQYMRSDQSFKPITIFYDQIKRCYVNTEIF